MDTQIIIHDDDTIDLVEVLAQGPAGPPGPQGLSGTAVTTYPAAVPVSGHTAVVLNAQGAALPADASDPTHYAVAGVTTQSASVGTPVEVGARGVLEHLGWSFTPGAPVLLGLAGALTQALPDSAVFTKVLGVALSPTRVSLDLQPAIFR